MFKTEIDIIEKSSKGVTIRSMIEWKCEFKIGNRSNDDLNPDFFGIEGMIITVPDQTIRISEDREISIKNVRIDKDLGTCTIDDFCLLPVELYVDNEDSTLFFV